MAMIMMMMMTMYAACVRTCKRPTEWYLLFALGLVVYFPFIACHNGCRLVVVAVL